MAIIVIALMGALAFLSYQLGKSHRENIEKDLALREKERDAQPLPTPDTRKRPIQPTPPRPTPPIIRSTPQPRPVGGRFVQVIFKKSGRKRYDYFLGDNNDVRVDDFVLVPIRKSKAWLDKELQRMLIEVEITGKPGQKPRKTTCLPARVKYISKPGEVSEHAKSTIIKKLNKKIW